MCIDGNAGRFFSPRTIFLFFLVQKIKENLIRRITIGQIKKKEEAKAAAIARAAILWRFDDRRGLLRVAPVHCPITDFAVSTAAHYWFFVPAKGGSLATDRRFWRVLTARL